MQDYIKLLCKLIETPSLSRQEEKAALLIRGFLNQQAVSYISSDHNTICKNKYWDDSKPTILLNSHIDTVKAAEDWTYNPFKATIEGDKIIGLGSNDAGASLVSLLATFLHYYSRKDLPYNLIYVASAEEEISGEKGMRSISDKLGKVDLAIIGEPTQMQMAIAEKGLMVLDCTAYGTAGHAARNEGVNALYKALDDITILRNYKFEKASEFLGEVKLSVTQIEAGYQHNVVPDVCKYVVDVRTNEHYSNVEALEIINQLIESKVEARSTRLNSSGIAKQHPIVERGLSLGLSAYGSPTTSDQAVISFPSIKIGPGNSARSHTANEYIYVSEIEQGFSMYCQLLEGLKLA